MKVTLLLAVFLMISCGGNKNSPDAQREEDRGEMCGGNKSTLCLPMAKWIMTSSKVNFPENFSIYINGEMILKQCLKDKPAEIYNAGTGRLSINFFHDDVPRQNFNIQILDLGQKCDNNAIFHTENNVAFNVIRTSLRMKEVRSDLNN